MAARKDIADVCGWTPKTDLLLSNPVASASVCGCHVGHGGYDILDRAFGPSFPADLLQELQRGGWIGDANGGRGRLRPARTKADVDVNELLQSLAGSFLGGDGNDLHTGSTADGENADRGVRGDESAFISRQERTEESFARKHPLLHRLVGSIERTARGRLGKRCTGTAANGQATNLAYFEFDTSLTSVQIAKYPGDGKAGYPRHCDRGATCLSEPMHAKHATVRANTTQQGKAERLLTFVYYLTPEDWDADLDGGALRMFMYSPAQNGRRDDEEKGCSGESDAFFDVTPYSDRLIVFRSDLVEHQVLPSLRRERIAVTVWLYGRVVSEGPNSDSAFLSSNGVDGADVAMQTQNGADKCSKSGLPPPLPLSATNESLSEKKEKIFVAIPSYRDEETWPTIKSLVETARRPERVVVGVVFQVDTSSREEVRRFTTAEGSGVSIEVSRWSEETHLRTMVLDYRHATGPCYARHLAQTLHRRESYVLQIDSHMRFRPNWDEYLIQQMNKKRPEKSVLTAYPPGYEPPNGPGPNAETRATILVPWKFGDDGMLRQKGRLLSSECQTRLQHDNTPCLLYAGGFNFFHSSLLDVCPYDAKLHGLFFGEEISMAVRLYTHGYDLYAPPETVCYHLWKRNPLRVREDGDGAKVKQREEALEVVRMQLRGTGRGLGTERTVEQFCKELGVDFEKKTLAPGCKNAGLRDDAFVSTNSWAADTGEGGAKDGNDLSAADMSSVLALVGQYMAKA